MNFVVDTIANYWIAKDSKYLPYGSVILPSSSSNDIPRGAHIIGRVDGKLIRTAPVEMINGGVVTTKGGETYILGYKSYDYEELLRARKDGIIIATDWFIRDKNRKNFWGGKDKICPCYEFEAKTMSCSTCRSISGEIVDQYDNHIVVCTSKGVYKDILVIWNNMSKRQHSQIKKDDGLLINIPKDSFLENFDTKSKPPILAPKSHD